MRILHILILLGGLAGVFLVYQDYANKEKKRRNIHSDQVRRVIADTLKDGQLTGEEDFTVTEEGAVFRVLAFMRQAEENGYSPAETAAEGCSSSGAKPGAAKIISERIQDNYAIAKKLGVFDDLNNVLRMERGLPPTAHAKGWEDEPLTVGHMLSPVIAPEAARSLANMVIMPQIARDMQSDDLIGFSFELSKKWLTDGVITPESHQAILAILDKKSKRGS